MPYTLSTNITNSQISSENLRLGDLAVVVNNSSHPKSIGHVLLRTYDRLVSLNDPYLVWAVDAEFPVSPLAPGASVTLIVKP